MNIRSYRAVILDLDGVVTRTATVHARAWKAAFDAFLDARRPREGEDHSPFDIDRDYRRYVDGKPRLDGIRSFLASRGIELPAGGPDDAPSADTVHGLGARKNRRFLKLLEREGVEAYPDAVAQVRSWRGQGLRTALITSSRNGEAVVEAAGARDLFDVMVDGAESARLGLAGKPAPDIFLEAARRLRVEPPEAIVVEDAIAGVEAGRAGAFGLVVGVARDGGAGLREHGADVVVRDLREVEDALNAATRDTSPKPALERMDEILDRLAGCRLALFLDYDGTLTPIVRRPEDARLRDEMRRQLRTLAERAFVAIVSGRDLDDVRGLVGLEDLHYAGSHGFDIVGPGGFRMQQESALARLPELDEAERRLRQALEGTVQGAWVERKRFALAVHYREARPEDEARLTVIVERVRRETPALRVRAGKKVFDIQPDVPWHKGKAVLYLLERLGLDGPDVVPAYVGDDTTDEDAFEALAGRGISVRVGSPEEPTRAEYYVRDTEALDRFLDRLADRLADRRSTG